MKSFIEDEFVEIVGKMNIRRKIRVPFILKQRAIEYLESRKHKGDTEWAFASHNHFNEGKRLAFDGVRAMIRKYNKKM